MQQDRWAIAASVGNSLCARLWSAGKRTDLRADLSGEDFEAVLVGLVAPYLREDAVLPVACALPDAEILYPAPAAPPTTLTPMPSAEPRIAMLGLAGLSQLRTPDLLGGRSAQVAGFVAAYPEWDGVLCLTGPHSKWVHISAGEVVSFQTYLTGELFGLLTSKSTLTGALAGDGWEDAAFADALSDAMSRPERVSGALYGLRADAQLRGNDPAKARARLSGMLTGMELAAARPYWLGQNVAVIGEGDDIARYAAALRGQGVPVQCHEAADLALRGLEHAYAAQQEDAS